MVYADGFGKHYGFSWRCFVEVSYQCAFSMNIFGDYGFFCGVYGVENLTTLKLSMLMLLKKRGKWMLFAPLSSFVCCGIFCKEYSFYMSHRYFRQVFHTGFSLDCCKCWYVL